MTPEQKQVAIAQLIGTGVWTAMQELMDAAIDRYTKILLGDEVSITDLEALNEIKYNKKDVAMLVRKELKKFRDKPQEYLTQIVGQKNISDTINNLY